MTEPPCTCGKRPKHKCCEENEHKNGKMCLKEDKDIYSEGGYTSCGACCGYGCDRCMPHIYSEEEQ